MQQTGERGFGLGEQLNRLLRYLALRNPRQTSSCKHCGVRRLTSASRLAHIIHSELSLTPGSRLGPYEVVAQIGAGGMGELYKATDTNLKRQVAIKVLPTSVAGDAERRLLRSRGVMSRADQFNGSAHE